MDGMSSTAAIFSAVMYTTRSFAKNTETGLSGSAARNAASSEE